MQGFAGKVAVVTGAGSGIGQALAIELARSGASVAISDVDTEGLAVTEERIKAIGAPVKVDRLDVTEREAFELYADAVKAHFGTVNQIYNNAGIGHVVNVSSLFGIFSVPGQAAYNSAKFAVRGFTEALRQEMIANGHPVKVTCVHPPTSWWWSGARS